MNLRPRHLLLATLIALTGLGTFAAGAQAATKHVYDFVGSSSSGTEGGQFNSPRDVAADEDTGDFYVVDENNHRIQRFSSDGSFISAWGADVATPEGGSDFELCTTAEDCKAGVASGGNGTAAGNGTLANPQGIAVDQDTGNVYVSDRNNRRINEYTATGSFIRAFGYDVVASGPDEAGTGYEICDVAANPTDICKAGAGANNTTATSPGANPGQFATTNTVGGYRIGVSRPDADPATGTLYLANTGSRRVETFKLDGTAPSNFGTTGDFGSSQPKSVAVDGDGVVYASNSASSNAIVRYDADESEFLDPLDVAGLSGTNSAATNGLAIDSATGSLLVARTTAVGLLEIADPAGTPAFAGQSIAGAGINPTGLGIDGAEETVFIPSTSGGHRVYRLDDAGAPDAIASTQPASDVEAKSATLNGLIDDNGPLPTDWRLEISRNGSDWSTVSTGQTAGGESNALVSGAAGELLPNSIYRVRLVTAKQFGGQDVLSGELTLLTDVIKPEIFDISADSINDTSARLTAQINPNSTQTTYYFEWGTSASDLRNQIPNPAAPIGAGPSQVFVAEQINGLNPDTTYWFRAVATSATEGETSGPVHSFKTGSTHATPAGRAYELVSPADKPGGQGVGSYSPEYPAGDAQPGITSTNGERYLVQSFAGNLTPGGFLYGIDYAMSERASDEEGWISHSPFTHHDYGPQGGANGFLDPTAASEGLETFGWSGTGSFVFPEMASWPTRTSVAYAVDWQGRWELTTPRDVTLGGGGTQFVSDNGEHIAYQTSFGGRGQLGDHDPSTDQTSGSVLYDVDLSAGISDEFTPNGAQSLVGACTGSGVDRTMIPVVDGSGKQGAEPCPAPLPDRFEALISQGGAAIGGNASSLNSMSTDRAISDDGSRVFFLSPDPGQRGQPDSCSGTGTTTSCPPQLYVRQLDGDGTPIVRWISQSEVEGQDASLTSIAAYEGAAKTGSSVFFRSRSPLTADDPNATGSAPVTTGTPSNDSWDLYRYDVPSDSNGRPSEGDPGDGELTRISAGPTGTGDCTAGTPSAGGSQTLRFASDDGMRAYFVCATPLAGVPTNDAPSNGTITSPGSDNSARNLYYYDQSKPLADRWEFIAQLPTGVMNMDACSTTESQPGEAIGGYTGAGTQFSNGDNNCFKGTPDGKFVTFMTSGRLIPSDPGSESLDVYAFDADSDQLIRIDAPQGGSGNPYLCDGKGIVSIADATGYCFGDTGISATADVPMLGVVTEPERPGDRIAFFQSKSRLVPEDTNDEYDVYEWRNGKLSLISAGDGPGGSYYAGNSADGQDVFFETRDQLSWQDFDGVMDVYDARAGGGVPEPIAPPVCDVLAGGCQLPPEDPPAPDQPGTETGSGGAGRGDAGPARSCTRPAKHAQRLKQRKQRLKRRARRASGKRAVRLKRRAKRADKKARRARRQTRTCRRGNS